MKTNWLLILALIINYSCTQKTKKPNVIIVFTDDQGYGDFSCHGNPILKTPNLDQLYNESVRFTNFHVAPVCTPSRSELITGLAAMNNKACMVPSGRNLMRRDILTMPEVFKQNGYHTGIFGKWHLGDSYPDRPMDRGFEKCIWHKGWGLPSEIEYDNDYYQTRYLDSLETIHSDKFCTNLWFDEAIKWMDEMCEKDKPFFTYLSTNAPHYPYNALEDDYNLYKDLVENKQTASFFGMINNIDQNMAKLDEWLESKKIKDNTVIVFMNDNGGTAGVSVYNAGMRGNKGSNYDGGHRAAFFMRWPEGNLGKPRDIHYASTIRDLLPTFIDLFNFKITPDENFDGESLKKLLVNKNRNIHDRMFVVQYGGRIRPEKYYSCIVWDKWRLVGKDELYDISNDPGQQNNIAGKNQEVLDKMRSYYEDWWKQVEPTIDEFIPVVVGSNMENPVIITSNTWMEVDVDNRDRVANAAGDVRGGVWNIEVKNPGNYRLELSRWPFHFNRQLTALGPSTTIGGLPINQGVALPVSKGCISVNNGDPVVSGAKPSSTKIEIEINLPQGQNTLQAWFKDQNGNDLCGAYYVRFLKL
jgi:arylsulfatase A-like enzyme